MVERRGIITTCDIRELDRHVRKHAACKGKGNLFYSDNPLDTEAAQDICNSECPVQVECLDLAGLNHEKDGVWGGVQMNQRYPNTRRKLISRKRQEIAGRKLSRFTA